MKKAILFILTTLIISHISAQSVSINSTNTPAQPDAILDVSSTTKGILIPKMTMAERDLINSGTFTEGLMIYQTDNYPGFYYWNGTSWMQINSGTGGSPSLTFGELYNASQTTLTISAPETYFGWTDASDGLFSNSSSDITNATADRLNITNSGTYKITVTMSFGTSTNNILTTGTAFINDVEQPKVKFVRFLGAGDTGVIACSGIFNLSEGDYIDFRMKADDTTDITIESINFNIIRLQ